MSGERKYNGIVFSYDYNKSFEEFVAEFGNTHVFKKMHPKERESALKEAYKIAIDGNTSKPAGKGEEAKK